MGFGISFSLGCKWLSTTDGRLDMKKWMQRDKIEKSLPHTSFMSWLFLHETDLIAFFSFRFFIRLIAGNPIPFALNYTVGHLLQLSASTFLCGPRRQFMYVWEDPALALVFWIADLVLILINIWVSLFQQHVRRKATRDFNHLSFMFSFDADYHFYTFSINAQADHAVATDFDAILCQCLVLSFLHPVWSTDGDTHAEKGCRHWRKYPLCRCWHSNWWLIFVEQREAVQWPFNRTISAQDIVSSWQRLSTFVGR